MKLALKISVRILAVVLIIVVPILIIYREFNQETVEVVRSGIGIMPSIFIFIMLMVVLGIVFGLMKQLIQNDKTQRLRIVFAGLTVIAIFVSINTLMKSLHSAIEISAENFLTAVNVYASVSIKIAVSAVIGVALIVIDYIFIKG